MRRGNVLFTLFLAAGALNGGSAPGQLRPENVLVVVNQMSRESLEVGARFVEKRGIPEENIVRLYVSAPSRVKWDFFENRVLGPTLNHVRDGGLTGRIHMVVLTKGLPYEVEGEAATWMFAAHGVRTQRVNPYFHAGRPLDAMRDFGPLRFPAVMLTAWNGEQAKAVVDRGLAAEGTRPDGTVYFLRGDAYRGVRHAQVPEAAAELALRGIRSELLSGSEISDRADVLGYLTGATRPATRNTYLPGAFAEHMTSYGGVIYNKRDQMSILDFIEAGATGSAGTVVEPTADWRKFPHASFYTAYAAGLTMGEAMWQSVATPYQTIFVGDPLACPFRAPAPAVEVLSVGMVEEGRLRVRVAADAGGLGHRLEALTVKVGNDFSSPVWPVPCRRTRLTLTFSRTAPLAPGQGAEVSIQADLAADEPPVAAMRRLALQINVIRGFPVRARTEGETLVMAYVPGEGIANLFRARCEGPDGGAPGWLPTVELGRFGQATVALPASARFGVSGRSRRDAEIGLDVGGVRRMVAVKEGQTAVSALQALAAAMGAENRFSGADGVVFNVTEAEKGAAWLIVRSARPGAAWNDTEVRLLIGSSGYVCTPYERRLKMTGGMDLSAGAATLALKPNPLAGGEEIRLTLGEKKIALTTAGNEGRLALLLRLFGLLRSAGDAVAASLDGQRIILRSKAETPPEIVIENTSDLLAADLLGGRWAAIPAFPPEDGVKPPEYRWLAVLRLHLGATGPVERETQIPIPPGTDAGEDVRALGFFDGPWAVVAEETRRPLVKE